VAKGEARLKIGLDIKDLQAATKEAKRSLEGLAAVDVGKNVENAFRKAIVEDSKVEIKRYRAAIDEAKNSLNAMANAGPKAWQPEKARKLASAVADLNEKLKETVKIQSSMKGGLGAGGGGGGLGGMMKKLGPLGRVAGMVGIGFGVSAALSRSQAQAQEGLRLRQMTGGGIVGAGGEFGFTRGERRQRAMEQARGAGRDFTEQELERDVNRGELAERAFGITGGQFGAGMGAARRAGVEDQSGFVEKTISDAFVVGMRGSVIAEYLEAMTGHLEGMAKDGIDVDEKSLRGFAGALGQMNFFKKDPSRIFDAISGLQQAFRGEGEYSQYLAYRSIQSAAGNREMTPSQIELRRRAPLFQGALPEKVDGMEVPEDIRETFDIGGSDMIQSMVTQSLQDTEGMRDSTRLLAFQESVGLKNVNQALPFFLRALKGQKIEGNELEKMKKAMEDAGFEGSTTKFASAISDMQTKIADTMQLAANTLFEGAQKFADAVSKMFPDEEKEPISAYRERNSKEIAKAEDTVFNRKMDDRDVSNVRAIQEGHALATGEGISVGRAAQESRHRGNESSTAQFLKGLTGRQGELGFENDLSTVEMPISGGVMDASALGLGPAKREKSLGEAFRDVIQPESLRTEDDPDALMDVDVPSSGVMDFPLDAAEFASGGVVYARKGRRIGKAAKSIRDAFGGGRRKRKKAADDGMRGAADFFTRGMKRIKRGAKKISRRAQGGREDGPRGTDTVPAWLTPGEYVVNADDTAKNLPALIHANQGGQIEAAGMGSSSSGPSIPDSIRLDASGMGDNTAALQNLTLALIGMVQRQSLGSSDVRGSSGMRYSNYG
jgi:hypothetical protein